MHSRFVRDDWRANLLLTGLGLLFFAPLVLHPDQVLYSDHSDLWALHLPMKHFLVRQWQTTGELPLWCPNRYGGTPFIHDIQVGAFYPLHFPLYSLPERFIGPGLSWLIVLHVFIAGWGMYAYVRSHELNGVGALVAAIGYMFAGRWLLHLLGGGHYITIGLAWLPWVLLPLEHAIRRGSIFLATTAGVVYALMILGTQPQWTFYSGLFIGMWTLGSLAPKAKSQEPEGSQEPRAESREPKRTGSWLLALGSWLLMGFWTVAVATALAAVQLLPTLEAVKYSSRSTGVTASDVLPLARLTLFALVGPAVTDQPYGLGWEERGGLGVAWLAAAVMAPFVSRRKTVQFQSGICLLLFVFALGGAVVVQRLPGFDLFRQTSRMFMVAAFPVAFMAGVTTDTLWHKLTACATRRRCRNILVVTLLITLLLVGTFAFQLHREHHPLRWHVYWLSLMGTIPAMYWLLGDLSPKAHLYGRWIWLGLLLVDLWALTWPLVAVQREADVLEPAACVRYLVEHHSVGQVSNLPPHDRGRVLDNSPRDSTTFPLGTGAPLAMLHEMEALRGYTPIDVLRYKEYLQFVGDADTPLRALEHDLTHPVIPNFPIRNKKLLDLLGTRYLIQPSDAGLPEPREDWRALFTDPNPAAYDCVAGGRRLLGTPCIVFENQSAMPRAFMVPEAAPLPERSQVLAALKTNDFRRRVLLEIDQTDELSAGAGESYRPLPIRDYRPNRVVIDVTGAGPGYLVLADIWFPGWTCSIDGRPAKIYRANFLFRGVPLPREAREVIFTFAPSSYERGRWVSAATVLLVLFISLGAFMPSPLAKWSK